ncbi:phage capsid protein [Nonomuraea sp. NPDC050783]|uniref:phage capsid protein n=1 Tax=Nonomuraea sp. NPDC050783 TaxID=3154634 RepID=UPI003466965E
MSITPSQANSFIAEYWSAILLTSLRKNAVVSSMLATNRDYEGNVRQGSKVHINSLVDPTVSPYTGGPITTTRLSTEDAELLISEGDYFSFTVKDVERVQAAGDLAMTATAAAGRKLLEVADQYVASQMIAEAGAKNVPISIPSGTNAGDALYDAVVDNVVQALDNNDVPEDRRFLIVTPRLKAMLLKSPKFIDASQYGSTDAIMNGEIGRFAGLTVQMTTNIPQTTLGTPDVDLIAGHPMATTYANQIQETESLRDPSDFADIVRGLHVYGAKVIRPSALVTAKVTVATT